MPDENQPIAITMERLLDLTNYIIDHMVNDAGGHVREVIETLSDLGFTEEELIEVFHFNETDVKVCLAYTDKDKESCKQKSIAEMKKVPQNLHS